MNLYQTVEQCLLQTSVVKKLDQVETAYSQFQTGELIIVPYDQVIPASSVGFPDLPQLVSPKELSRRGYHDQAGRIGLLHSIAHIEFNAINLALDAVYRFRDLPYDYYADWFKVAIEEVKHFRLLEHRLRELGSAYGELLAHRGLWDMAEATQDDILARMAVVPRYLEARGLDVTPAMITKLKAAGDEVSAAILTIILEEEIGHVKAGSHWFSYLCRQKACDPVSTYFSLIEAKLHGKLRGPFNLDLRKQAGFSDLELQLLSNKA